ncbi:MAG TPA: hypothetical protein PK079_15585, partial [Leptospiraceae bacterium]|nr:hypothetical protein [Leptospiraceae bacterium]
MGQFYKQIIKSISFLVILGISTGSLVAQKSGKKATKTSKTAKTTTTTTTSTTTKTTKTTTTVEKKPLETKISAEEQKKQDINTGKKLSSGIKTDAMKTHNVLGLSIKRYISNEEGKLGADVLEVTGESKVELSSVV